jgi:hypothetical protein
MSDKIDNRKSESGIINRLIIPDPICYKALSENLNEETLAIFDLLRTGKTLTSEENKEVKKVAADILTKLKSEKLKVKR